MKIIDISVSVDSSIPVWEGDNRPVITEEKADYVRGTIQTSTVMMNVHTGTHIDAPRHFYPNGKTAPEIGLSRLLGKCIVVELPKKNKEISKMDLVNAGLVKSYQRVLLKTQNSALWKSEGKVFYHDYVALDESAANYLIELGVDLVGIDYLSIAPFANVWDVHQTLLAHEVILLEGLNLSDVEPGEYELLCLPMKLDSKDGLPVRAVLRRY